MTEIYVMLEAGEEPMLGAMETNLVYYSALCTSLCGEQSISLSSQHPQFTAPYIKSFMKENFSFFDIFQIEFNPTKAGKHYSVSSNFTGLKSFHRKVDWLKSWYHQVEEGIRGQGEHRQPWRIHTDIAQGSVIIMFGNTEEGWNFDCELLLQRKHIILVVCLNAPEESDCSHHVKIIVACTRRRPMNHFDTGYCISNNNSIHHRFLHLSRRGRKGKKSLFYWPLLFASRIN